MSRSLNLKPVPVLKHFSLYTLLFLLLYFSNPIRHNPTPHTFHTFHILAFSHFALSSNYITSSHPPSALSADMADKTIDERQSSLGAEGQASGSASIGGSGSLNSQSSSKKTTEKKTPKKLGNKKLQQQPTPEPTPEVESEGEAEAIGNAGVHGDAESSDLEPEPRLQKAVSRRRQSRGRGRKGGPDYSDGESVTRSDVSATGGRRNRQRQRAAKRGGGPLDGITENVPGGEFVNGAGNMVQNTAGNAVNSVGNTAGQALGGLTGGGKQEDDGKDKSEQLRLRLELNLDIEIQLKAKIHGDLTLGLL
jgi:hypothetical protein